MSTKADLAAAWERLAEGLDWLDQQPPDGRARAAAIRTRLHAHLTALSDGIAGKTQRCQTHRSHFAHNCPPCRSEQIGRADYDPPAWPPNPIADLESRKLGEARQHVHIGESR